MNLAVLAIDMLNDFVTGSLQFDRGKDIIIPLRQLLEQARKHHIPVVYVNDRHVPLVDKELSLWGNHALLDSIGANVISELKPHKNDFIVYKRRYSGFFQTDLHLLLQELKVDSLILTGIHTHLCVKHTAADAYYWGYHISVATDATQALSKQAYKDALKEMKQFYAAKLLSVRQIVDLFQANGNMNL